MSCVRFRGLEVNIGGWVGLSARVCRVSEQAAARQITTAPLGHAKRWLVASSLSFARSLSEC
eukprot:3527906-Rhodomonas_salina.1